jgi:alkylation response protein AidB-like acyl-CoA dehydrogenase
LPIIYFGTQAAKAKYLPKIASGEVITAYALTEAGSGSDAMAAKATARLSADGTHHQRREDVHQRWFRRHFHRVRKS